MVSVVVSRGEETFTKDEWSFELSGIGEFGGVKLSALQQYE